jgi:hypothetical protein
MNLPETKIRAMIVLEILGRPPEFLTENLNDLIKKIGEEKGVKIKETKINPPILMKEQKDFYTSFAEIELETDNLLYLAILMFKYMPAYIEIISPENISLKNSEVNDIFNELARRLHGYEEIARILQTEKGILEKKLRELSGEKGSEDAKEETPEKRKKKKN